MVATDGEGVRVDTGKVELPERLELQVNRPEGVVGLEQPYILSQDLLHGVLAFRQVDPFAGQEIDTPVAKRIHGRVVVGSIC